MPSFKSYQEKTRKGQRAQLKASVKRAEDAGTLVPENERFVGIEPDVKPIPYRSSPEEKERMRVVSKMMPTFERFKQFQARTLPVTEREPGRTEPSKPDEPNELPGRDIPVVGHVLRALDYIGEHGPSGAVAEYAQPEPLREEFLRANHQEPATGVNKLIGQVVAPFVQPGGGVGVGVNSLYRGAGAALNRLAPGLERTLGGRVAGETLREAAVGAPTAGAQALTRTGDTEQAAKEAAIGGGVGALGGAAGPLIGAGIRRGFKAFKASQSAAKPVESVSPSPAPTKPTEEVAAESAPPMKGNWFTNLFGDVGVGITPFGSNKRVGNKPLTTEEQIVGSPLRKAATSTVDTIKAAGRTTYQNHVDALDPLKKIRDDVYDTAMDANRSNNIANVIVNDKFVNAQGQVIGNSLKDIFRKVARGADKKFVDYLTLRHAGTRLARGERVYDESLGLSPETPEGVAARIARYDKQFPEFSQLAKEWDDFNDNMLKTWGVDEGLISEEAYGAMREKNPFYSPMRRQFSAAERIKRRFESGGNKFSGQKAPLKQVSPTGSTRLIVDPRRSTIEAAGAWVNAAMRNRTMQEIVKAIQENPEAMQGIADIVKTPSNTKKGMIEALSEGSPDEFLESLNSDFNTLFAKAKAGDDSVVRAMIGGRPVHIKVHDPEAVKALIGMGSEQTGPIVNFLSIFSNLTKRGATGALAPLFAAKSLTADVVAAAIQSKKPLLHLAVDLPHALISSLADRARVPILRNLAQDFRRAGGEYSAALRGERPLRKSISSITRYPILSGRNLAKVASNTLASPFRIGEEISDISENLNRMAAYRREMKIKGGVRSKENVREAINAAREITTNFSRKGLKSREIEAAIPYQNAAIQGAYRFIKAWKAHPLKTAATVGGLVIAPKLLEYARFHDDPDYQKLPSRERYRNIILRKNSDGSFVKIPMPPEWNAVGALTTDILQYVRDDDPVNFKASMDALLNAMVPPVVSGAAQGYTQGTGLEGALTGVVNASTAAPGVAIIANKSFTGAPIEPMSLTDRSPGLRYDERTSSIAKRIGELTGFSPMKTDYLIRSYGGDPARLLLPLTSELGGGTTRNTLLKNFIVDPTYTNTLTNDFYSAKESLSQAKRDHEEAGKPLPVWFNESLHKLVTSRAKGSISKRLSDLSARKKEVMTDRSLNKDAKARALRDIQSQMNSIYLDANAKMVGAGVPIR